MASKKELLVEINAKLDGLEKGLKKAEKKTVDFGKTVKKAGALLATYLSASVIVHTVREMSKLAGEAEGVRNAFKRIADQNTLNDLREATRGTISDLELMKRTVSASNLGLPVQNLSKLFEFASRRAQETGESVDYLVNSIVTGIGRKSTMILDNLGISATRLKKELGGAGLESVSTFEMAAAVARIANEELGKMGDVLLTSKDRAEQLNAELENLKVTIGDRLNPTINNFRKIMLGFLNKASFTWKAYRQEIEDTTFTNVIDGLKSLDQEAARSNIVKHIQDINIQTGYYTKEIDKLNKKPKWKVTSEDRNNFNLFNTIVEANKNSIERLTKIIALSDTEFDKFLKTIGAVDDGKNQITIIGELTDKIKDLKKQVLNVPKGDFLLLEELNRQILIAEATLKRLQEYTGPEATKKKKRRDEGSIGLMVEGYIPPAEIIPPLTPESEKAYSENVKKLRDLRKEIDLTSVDTLTLSENFGQMWMQAAAGADNMADAMKKGAAASIQAIIAEGVAHLVKSVFATVPFPANLAIAAGIGAAGGGIMNALIPSFANEGRVTSPTLAMVGDYPGASTNPEYMLKESTIKNMMGGSLNITGRIVAEATQLAVILERANRVNNIIG